VQGADLRADSEAKTALRRAFVLTFLTSLAAVLAAPLPAAAFGGLLNVGAEGGYSQLYRASGSDPLYLHGGGVGAFATYGFTESWGLTLEGAMTWHAPYMLRKTVENEDGEKVQKDFAAVNDIAVRGAALSIVYAIDVLKVTPFIALGGGAVQVSELVLGREYAAWDAVFRAQIGFDCMLLEHMSIGAAARYDTLLAGTSEFTSTLNVFLRVSMVFDVGGLGARDASR
jgi:hypothetical protein